MKGIKAIEYKGKYYDALVPDTLDLACVFRGSTLVDITPVMISQPVTRCICVNI
ncbi:MAG: hypothetical protein M1308_06570 [Actinobacteria bacterium]|nr:hypothetical protein [Actinomycetota bacterium]